LHKFNKLNRQQHEDLIRNLLALRTTDTLPAERSASYKNRFMVKTGDSIVTVKAEHIHHFISEDGLVLLVNQIGKRFPVDHTLDQLEPLLDPTHFFRINRRIILHIDSVKKAGTYFNSRLLVHATHLDGDNAIVSRDRVPDFKAWLNG